MNICGGTIPSFPQQVFIEPHKDDWLFGGADWIEMPEAEARRSGQHIIRCSYCDKPAVKLDGFYPWMATGNLCGEHATTKAEGWTDGSRRAHYFRGFHSLCWRWEKEYYTFPGEVITTKPPCATCLKRVPKEALAGKRRGRR